MSAPYRVIQWTTGNIGSRSLHAILSRPDYELVGVYAHGKDKVGRDAAELCNWPEPTGVHATDDIEALIALRPDACCYNPLWADTDELVTLLENGINVVTTAGWINGWKLGPTERARVEDACHRGGASIYGSGAHPGLSTMVGMVLTSACERVDRVVITESVDASTYASQGTMAAMGFGRDPGEPGLAESVGHECEVFAEAAAVIAEALGYTVDEQQFEVVFTPAEQTDDLGFMTIPQGTVAGAYGYHHAISQGRPVVSVGFNWTMGRFVTPPKKQYGGHVVQVFGIPNMRTILHCLPPDGWTPEQEGSMGIGMIYTAMPATNAIAAVVAAAPGIVTLADVPPVVGSCGTQA